MAFVVTESDWESNEYRSAIWTVPSDGSQPPRRFTAGTKRDVMPRWSPGGRHLAFVSSRDDDKAQLFVLPLDGGEPIRLTECKQGVAAPVWSPDGASLAFVSTVSEEEDEDEGNKRPPHRITRLKFKADGAGWRVGRFDHVFVVAADDSAPVRRLTEGDFDHRDPAWSPDGKHLCVAGYREEDWDVALATDLFVVDVSTGRLRRLTNSDAQYGKPSWSPDGTQIAARVYPDVSTAPRNSHIVVMDVESGDVRTLTAELDRQCGPYFQPREPIWTNGRLLFPVESEGNGRLYEVDGTGGVAKPVITGEFVVTDHDLVGQTLVHAVSTPTRPPELFVGDRRLTHLTDEFVGSVPLASPQRFTAVGSDGSEVEAWAMAPPQSPEGRRHPTLLFIHGGPFAQYGNLFLDEFQVATGAGYGVVYSNPRGSSGYAEDWGRAIRGPLSGGPGWGTVDYDDVMAVMDEAVDRFDFIDPERLGVLGGSYGGFLTTWIIGHTDRFKAACAERGIYNVMSAIGTSDGLWSSRVVWGGDPYEHIEKMMQISPLTYADRMTTPLLLIHSDEDHRCPVEQAEQLFTRLRLLGREVELLRFPRGTHDLSRMGPPRQRVYRFEAILDWFDRYLRS